MHHAAKYIHDNGAPYGIALTYHFHVHQQIDMYTSAFKLGRVNVKLNTGNRTLSPQQYTTAVHYTADTRRPGGQWGRTHARGRRSVWRTCT